MVSKEMVGTRIRQVRTGLRKTLKDVEAASGFSSTHISEIERGRTSPTIGALIRIAHALDKDPSYFIEERELEEVCITTRDDRSSLTPGFDLAGEGVRVESLTRGILGGRLLAFEMTLDRRAEARIVHLPEHGDLCLVCTAGSCTLGAAGEAIPFGEGDSLHTAVEDARFEFRGDAEAETKILVLLDPREALS